VSSVAAFGRRAGFSRDVRTVAGRAPRQLPREPASVLPAVFLPAFFYVVNCTSPVSRLALLLGLMAADVAVVVGLCVPLLGLGYAVGVHFRTGPAGVLAFLAFSGLWGLAFTGFPYAVALRTGSPAAVNACFVVFFPLFFLTDAFVPKATSTAPPRFLRWR
jgi:ABC-2 type transport system permease protein